MDEHDPRFDPSVQEAWEEIPGPHWIFVAIAVGLVIALLSGCEDIDRQIRVQEWKDRFVHGCLPRKGDTVTAQWVNGKLICQRTTPTGRYGRSFPHTENRVAIVEPM